MRRVAPKGSGRLARQLDTRLKLRGLIHDGRELVEYALDHLEGLDVIIVQVCDRDLVDDAHHRGDQRLNEGLIHIEVRIVGTIPTDVDGDGAILDEDSTDLRLELGIVHTLRSLVSIDVEHDELVVDHGVGRIAVDRSPQRVCLLYTSPSPRD